MQHIQTLEPLALLLQEANSKQIFLPGYLAYFQPTIPDNRREMGAGSSVACPGKPVIYVDKGVPQTPIDLSAWCSAFQEAVAVRLKVGSVTYVIASVYNRPYAVYIR